MVKNNAAVVKNSPLQNKKPWEGDVLGRKAVAIDFTHILKTLATPHVVSINASYGMGKSFFMDNWYQDLKEENTVFFFNAWENDFSDDPLMAFVFELQEQAKAMGLKKESSALKGLLASAGQICVQTMVAAAETVSFGSVDLEELNADEKKRALHKEYGTFANAKLQAHLEVKDGIKQFKKRLKDIAHKAKEVKPNSKLPIIVFIDELDRCRPDFAVQLLENIKHIFSTEGFIFILGMDRSQLKHAIGVIYGHGMDGEGYLRRFIDLELSLPDPHSKSFIKFLIEGSNLQKMPMNVDNSAGLLSLFEKTFREYAAFWKLTLRTQKQIYKELEISIRNLDGEYYYPQMLAFLGILEVKDKELYTQIGESIFDYKKVVQKIEGTVGREGYHIERFQKEEMNSMLESLWTFLERDFSRLQWQSSNLQQQIDIRHSDDGRSMEDIHLEYKLLGRVLSQATYFKNNYGFYDGKIAPVLYVKQIIDIGASYST